MYGAGWVSEQVIPQRSDQIKRRASVFTGSSTACCHLQHGRIDLNYRRFRRVLPAALVCLAMLRDSRRIKRIVGFASCSSAARQFAPL